LKTAGIAAFHPPPKNWGELAKAALAEKCGLNRKGRKDRKVDWVELGIKFLVR